MNKLKFVISVLIIGIIIICCGNSTPTYKEDDLVIIKPLLDTVVIYNTEPDLFGDAENSKYWVRAKLGNIFIVYEHQIIKKIN